MTNRFADLKKALVQKLLEAQFTSSFSAGIYGGVSRNEHILGWSDLDVLIFCSERSIPDRDLLVLRTINASLSEQFPEIPMTFRIHSSDEFPDYEQFEGSLCSYSLFAYMKDFEVLYGDDLRLKMKSVLRTISITQAIADLRSKLISSRHESRSIISSSTLAQPFTQSFHVDVAVSGSTHRYTLAKYIDIILESALVCTILKGVFDRDKLSTANSFKNLFSQYRYADLPLKAANMRASWGSQQEPVLSNEFLTDASNFFESILDLFDEQSAYNQVNNAFEGLLINDSDIPYRDNSCGIILDEQNNLLIVQKEGKEWTLVQGGREDSDVSVKDTIVREMNEELGLLPSDFTVEQQLSIKNVFDWPDSLQQKKGFRGQSQSIFLIRYHQGDIRLDPEELTDFKWVPFDDHKEYIAREDYLEVLAEFKLMSLDSHD